MLVPWFKRTDIFWNFQFQLRGINDFFKFTNYEQTFDFHEKCSFSRFHQCYHINITLGYYTIMPDFLPLLALGIWDISPTMPNTLPNNGNVTISKIAYSY